jgi:hypothetical protein
VEDEKKPSFYTAEEDWVNEPATVQTHAPPRAGSFGQIVERDLLRVGSGRQHAQPTGGQAADSLLATMGSGGGIGSRGVRGALCVASGVTSSRRDRGVSSGGAASSRRDRGVSSGGAASGHSARLQADDSLLSSILPILPSPRGSRGVSASGARAQLKITGTLSTERLSSGQRWR